MNRIYVFYLPHDIDPSNGAADIMERYYYRIWARNVTHADSLFLKIPEIVEYIIDIGVDIVINRIHSGYNCARSIFNHYRTLKFNCSLIAF